VFPLAFGFAGTSLGLGLARLVVQPELRNIAERLMELRAQQRTQSEYTREVVGRAENRLWEKMGENGGRLRGSSRDDCVGR
jgi:argininosuccinate lyase